MLTIVRSPAKVCWHIKLGEELLATRDTKHEAEKLKDKLEAYVGAA